MRRIAHHHHSSALDRAIARRAKAAELGPNVASEYRFRLAAYLTDVLGIALHPPFDALVDEIAISWFHLHVQQAQRQGLQPPQNPLSPGGAQLYPEWDGEPIPNVFAVEGGHKLGKSYTISGICAWVYHVSPKLVGCVYAPKVKQATAITWRYVDKFLGRSAYTSGVRPHRVGGATSPSLMETLDRKIVTQAASGGVKVQGSHEAVGFHLMEEAEGIDDPELFDAVRTLTADGVSLWILAANPASSSSPFATLSGKRVMRFQMSCLEHPNVKTGRIVVPGAVTREWVDAQVDPTNEAAWAKQVDRHSPDDSTFEFGWRPGIWKPLPPFWWRVWGKPPPTTAADAAVSAGAYRAALERYQDVNADHEWWPAGSATIGVDSARGGEDSGRIARRWQGALEMRRTIHDRSTLTYVAATIEELERLYEEGAQSVEVRVDVGGGYGAWVDHLAALADILDAFPQGGRVVECHFGARPYDDSLGANWITCAYLDTGAALKHLSLRGATRTLEEDLCSRRVAWVDHVDSEGVRRTVRKLERKENFRTRMKRSPDEGDALALAGARWGQGLE